MKMKWANCLNLHALVLKCENIRNSSYHYRVMLLRSDGKLVISERYEWEMSDEPKFDYVD